MKKKILLCLICGILLLGVTGCGNNKYYSVGDTIKNNDWVVTLKSAEFVDFMNIQTDSTGRYGGKDFGSTTIEPASAEYKLEGKNGNVLLAYTFEFKYTGKEEYSDNFFDVGKTHIVYNDEYNFNENYFNFVMDKEQQWVLLSNDSNAMKGVPALQNMYTKHNKYPTLDDTVYSVKGVIAVPEKVKNDTESPLTIEFDVITDEAFTIR